jgi:copper transport protein
VTRRRERPGRLAGPGVALLIAAEPLSFLAQLASLSFDSETALAVAGSGFGRIIGLRLGAALLAWTLIAIGRSWPILAVGAVVAALDGAGAHAFPQAPFLGQATVSLHVAAMGLWVGGTAAFVRSPDARFGRYAAITLGVALATGLVLALVHTSLGSALFTSDYGLVVFAKVAVVGAAVVAVAVRRHRLELGLAIVTIAVAGVLAALPPPV